jgi:hypothetical protein
MGNGTSRSGIIVEEDDLTTRAILAFKQIQPIKTQPNEFPQSITIERWQQQFVPKIRGLRPDEIAQLTPVQIKKMPPALIGSLTKEQQEGFTLAHIPHFTVNQLKQLKFINPAIVSKIDIKLIQQLPEEFKKAYINIIGSEGVSDIKKTAALCKGIQQGQRPEVCMQVLQLEQFLNNPGQFEPQYQAPIPQYARYPSQGSRPIYVDPMDGGRRKKYKSKKAKHRLAKKTRRSRK